MRYQDILARIRSLSDLEAVKGMARFGISRDNNYGISIPNLQKLAKKIGKDHLAAEQLWSSGIHDAKILACMMDDPNMVPERQVDLWVKDFDSWDVCDQCCNRLFRKTEFAYKKAIEWSGSEEEFIKRAGFVLMACLAVHDKKAKESIFEQFFPIIKREAVDERNYVKKAVNWALRQIGKRSILLNKGAIRTAGEIQVIESKSARWIASDALRELQSEKIQQRLKK